MLITLIDSNGTSEDVALKATGKHHSVPPNGDSWIWRSRPTGELSDDQADEWSKESKYLLHLTNVHLPFSIVLQLIGCNGSGQGHRPTCGRKRSRHWKRNFVARFAALSTWPTCGHFWLRPRSQVLVIRPMRPNKLMSTAKWQGTAEPNLKN